jgi:hypothetical protein
VRSFRTFLFRLRRTKLAHLSLGVGQEAGRRRCEVANVPKPAFVPHSMPSGPMFISLAYSRTHGFRRWSEAHVPLDKADQAGDPSLAIAGPPTGEPEELPRLPGLSGSGDV